MHKSRKASAADAPRTLPPPMEEDIAKLKRLEEKRSSRPPSLEKRAVPFESILRDFVSDVSRKRGTAPP